MGFKAWVVNVLDCRMVFQEPGNLERALILIFYPHRQGFQTAMEQKTGVGIK